MPQTAQDPDQTLQPPVNNAPSSNSAENEALTLQPDHEGSSRGQPPDQDLTLQPPTGSGGNEAGSKKNNTDLTLQPPTDKQNQSEAQDPSLSLQPHESNPSETKSNGQGQDTGLTLQPGADGAEDDGASGSDSKNPLKKAVNYFKKEATRQSDGPPTLGNE